MYRLLHIEADAATHRLVVQALANSPLPFTVEQVSDTTDAAPPVARAGDNAAEGAGIDALLLGTRGQAPALASLARWREWFPGQPIIVLTDKADLAFARDALRAGAQDVVQLHDPALAVLSRILLYTIERAGAEMRGKLLQAETADLMALLDGLLAGTSEAVVQTDWLGTLQRASPGAAALIGVDLPLPRGSHLAERVEPTERARLRSFIATSDAAASSVAATFSFKGPGDSRLLELRPLALTDQVGARMRLFRVTELAAEFANDVDLANASAAACGAGVVAFGEAAPSSVHLGKAAQNATPNGRNRATMGQDLILVDAMTEPAAEATIVAGSTTSPLVQLRALTKAAKWHLCASVGDAVTHGFVAADPESAQTLHRLAVTAREDFDVALGVDTLRVKGWQDVAHATPELLPERLLVEVSYGTVASRPHYERLLAAIDASPVGLAERFLLVLQGVPKGIYVPTLGKAIRAMGASHGKPGLQLPDLDTDYRNLVLGHLTLLVVAIEDLKRALARDGKQVTTFLARARSEGCRTLVRGATGPLAEALRTRLGIDMTVDA